MNARLGSNLHTIPPRRILTPRDYGYLFVLLAISASLHIWLVSHITVTARDGMEFARIALNMRYPKATSQPTDEKPRNIADIVKSSVHPPGYPAVVLATWQIVRLNGIADVPEQVLKSAQIASAIASILLVFPTYWLGRMLFGSRFVGFAGAALFQTLPTVSHLTSDALSEAWYILFASTALLFGVRGLRRRSTLMFLFAGFFAGASYLVRPEGLMLVLALGVTLAGLGVFRLWPKVQAIGRLTALVVGFGVCASPYIWLINGLSNKTTFQNMIDRMKGNPAGPVWKGGQAQGIVQSPLLFAEWSAGQNRLIWSATALFKETSKACHYSIFVLGILGILYQRKRIVRDPGLAVLCVFGVINSSVLMALGIQVGYLSERHTMMLVLLACFFAAAALEPIAHAFGMRSKFAALGILVLLLGANLPSALKAPHQGRAGHPHAGKYLAEHVGPNDAVIDPYCWAEWYAGRTQHAIPSDPIAPKARWVVKETGPSPHSRLPRYEEAENVVKDGKNSAELVYWWPEDVAKKDAPTKARVLVYRQMVPE